MLFTKISLYMCSPFNTISFDMLLNIFEINLKIVKN